MHIIASIAIIAIIAIVAIVAIMTMLCRRPLATRTVSPHAAACRSRTRRGTAVSRVLSWYSTGIAIASWNSIYHDKHLINETSRSRPTIACTDD